MKVANMLLVGRHWVQKSPKVCVLTPPGTAGAAFRFWSAHITLGRWPACFEGYSGGQGITHTFGDFGRRGYRKSVWAQLQLALATDLPAHAWGANGVQFLINTGVYFRLQLLLPGVLSPICGLLDFAGPPLESSVRRNGCRTSRKEDCT